MTSHSGHELDASPRPGRVNGFVMNIHVRAMLDRVPRGTDGELNPSSYALLAMVRDGVSTGYRMKQALERFASFFWSASYGQIYPVLKRLEDAGMITGHDATSSGRLRREYSLTSDGEAALDQWLAEPKEPSVWLQNEGILRLMIVDWDDRELTRKNLDALRTVTARRLDALSRLTPPRERGQRLQDLGKRLLEETLSWCDETEVALRAARPPARRQGKPRAY